MKMVFDDRALADLEHIFRWISRDSPSNALMVVDRLFSSAELLTSFPEMGHSGRDPGLFEWVVPRLPYIVVYEIDEDEQLIVVTAVFHGPQDRDG